MKPEVREWVRPGSVVQIAPEHNETFGACLLLVTEVKTWGVQGSVRVPGGGDAYYRVKWEAVEYVGEATWLPAHVARREAQAPIDVPTPYPAGSRVTWQEGRSARPRTGTVEAVHEQPGWPAEYDVRPIRKDGTPCAQVQRRHHSELEAKGS